MTKTDHWMPLYIGDYLADTMHLQPQEHGAYLLLLMHYWRTGPLPDDDKKLAGIARCSARQWSAIMETVRAFFVAENGELRQKRMDAERERHQLVMEAKRRGGKARWTKDSTVKTGNGAPPVAQADGEHMHGHMQEHVLSTELFDAKLRTQPQLEERKIHPTDGAEAPLASQFPDVRTELWNDGLRLLRGLTGKPEPPMRRLLGQLLKSAGDDCALVLAKLRQAADLRPVEPVAWLTAAVSHDRAGNANARLFAAAGLAPDGTLLQDKTIEGSAFELLDGRLLQ